MQEPKNNITHGGLGRLRFLLESLKYKTLAVIAAPAAARDTRANKHSKTCGARNNCAFQSRNYPKSAAARIAAAAAAADARGKKKYKTLWAGKEIGFYLGTYLQMWLQ